MSVRVKQLGMHTTDFHEILYLSFSPDSIETINVSFKIRLE